MKPTRDEKLELVDKISFETGQKIFKNVDEDEQDRIIKLYDAIWNLAIEKAAEIPETTNESNIILKLKY